jgi:hypothetical protein
LREKYCWLVADKPSEQGGPRQGRARAACLPRGHWCQRSQLRDVSWKF